MLQPKFIITSAGDFRLGMVDMHRDLLRLGEECRGGGFYEFDFVRNRLVLSGRSYDYGPPLWHSVVRLRVPAVYRGLCMVYVPDSPQEDEVVVAECIEVEYC